MRHVGSEGEKLSTRRCTKYFLIVSNNVTARVLKTLQTNVFRRRIREQTDRKAQRTGKVELVKCVGACEALSFF